MPLIFLRAHNNSISHGLQSPEKILSSFKVRLSFVTNYVHELKDFSKRVLLQEAIGLYVTSFKSKNSFTDEQLAYMYCELKRLLPKRNQRILLWILRLSYWTFHKGDSLKFRLQSSI
jgi:hypothetical protein